MSEFGFSRRALLRLVSSGALASGAAASNQGDTPASNPLRYLDTARRLTVQAYVNTHGPFDFLVDTGANSSVIAAELAAQLGLPRGAESRLHSIAGTQTVATARVARLAVGKRVRNDLVVSVLPREQLRMDGVLGLEWLARASLLLDFKQRRMTVGEALPVPDARTVIVKSKLLRSGLTLIDAFMPLQRLVAFVDSGSTTTVGNLAMLEAARQNNALIGELNGTELRSVTGQVLAGRAATLSRLTLGGMTLRNIPLVFGPIHTFDYWGFREQPAIVIGVDILQRFDRVSMDFKRNEVRFRVPG
ncbi:MULTISPECIES: aspartyl protease family protein [unclassified Caulobacter]|uniref:aspartyl protease family protein n=1 Tax=unclassified Caulobacter TaxID=2648921 RepID=UPI000782E119|nr:MULTISPECIES: aspartyl protease family protein [unclassified Caulobacter]AZS22086.1 aspartyl protease [Caulobacter sp. FWC26]